jgi:hypothetical protein
MVEVPGMKHDKMKIELEDYCLTNARSRWMSPTRSVIL